MSIVKGPPAFVAGRVIFHLPSFAVTVLKSFLLKRIFTLSPGEAQPQILIGLSLCNTMLSLTSCGNRTCASTLFEHAVLQARRKKNIFKFSFMMIIQRMMKLFL